MAAKVNKKRRSAVQSVVCPLIFGIALIAAWQTGLLHILLNTDEYVLPYPTRILTIMGENSDKIMMNVWASVQVAVLGLLFGSLLGYLIAIFAATFPKFGSGGLTIVSAFNAIPIVALAPVIINWTKDVSSEAEVRSTYVLSFNCHYIKRVSPSVPYGYLRDPADKQKLIIDEEPAQIVRRIFDMIIAGKGVNAVARALTEDKVLIPSAYAAEHCPENCHSKCFHDKYHWTPTAISYILEKREYMGDTVLGKTVSVNFKTKKRRKAEEDELMIHSRCHPSPTCSRVLQAAI